MATFILVRHAEGTHNLAAETEGDAAYQNPLHKDARLTDKGVQQARAAGKLIADKWPSVTAVWSSPLTRCLQTATYIMESVNVPNDEMHLHEYLIERQRTGDVCNHRSDEKSIQDAWPHFKANFSQAAAEDGESQYAVKQRLTILLEHLKRKYTSGTVIIISHYEALFDIVGRGLNNAEFVVLE